jgi:hypothetical protein
LFIYAATLCRFVYDENRRKDPKRQLKQWLEQCDDNKSQLNQIYEPILNQLFLSNDKVESDQKLQVLGAIVLLAIPLPASSLVALLGMDMNGVNWWLPDLHAVLDVTGNCSTVTVRGYGENVMIDVLFLIGAPGGVHLYGGVRITCPITQLVPSARGAAIHSPRGCTAAIPCHQFRCDNKKGSGQGGDGVRCSRKSPYRVLGHR